MYICGGTQLVPNPCMCHYCLCKHSCKIVIVRTCLLHSLWSVIRRIIIRGRNQFRTLAFMIDILVSITFEVHMRAVTRCGEMRGDHSSGSRVGWKLKLRCRIVTRRRILLLCCLKRSLRSLPRPVHPETVSVLSRYGDRHLIISPIYGTTLTLIFFGNSGRILALRRQTDMNWNQVGRSETASSRQHHRPFRISKGPTNLWLPPLYLQDETIPIVCQIIISQVSFNPHYLAYGWCESL